MNLRHPALLAFPFLFSLVLAGCDGSVEQQDTTGSGDGPTAGTGSTNDTDAPTDAPEDGAGTTGSGG